MRESYVDLSDIIYSSVNIPKKKQHIKMSALKPFTEIAKYCAFLKYQCTYNGSVCHKTFIMQEQLIFSSSYMATFKTIQKFRKLYITPLYLYIAKFSESIDFRKPMCIKTLDFIGTSNFQGGPC